MFKTNAQSGTILHLRNYIKHSTPIWHPLTPIGRPLAPIDVHRRPFGTY